MGVHLGLDLTQTDQAVQVGLDLVEGAARGAGRLWEKGSELSFDSKPSRRLTRLFAGIEDDPAEALAWTHGGRRYPAHPTNSRAPRPACARALASQRVERKPHMTKRVAVVTGASRGLGAAIADRLAADGWSVACLATSLEGVEGVAAALADRHGVRASAHACLVEDRAQVDEVLASAEGELGPVSLMVNNAGIAQVAPFLDTTEEDFRRIVDINLMGVFHGSQAAAR